MEKEVQRKQERTMSNRKQPSGLDRRDEWVLVIFAVLVPLLAIPAMLGV